MMTGTFLNYNSVTKQLKALIEDDNEAITILSNTSSLLYWNLFDVNWLGFYFIKNNELILGPFQGKPACTHLKLNTGVCGDAIQKQKTIRVDDVLNYPNHIFCDMNSKSEVVVPIFINNIIIGVLDIDSPTLSRFNHKDEDKIQKIVTELQNTLKNVNLSMLTDVFELSIK